MAANDPTWALDDTADIIRLTKAVLSFDLDTRNAVDAVSPNFFLSQASGTPLVQKASDYGYNASQGSASSGYVIFKMASGVSSGVTVIPASTILQVAGDGITTPTLSFGTTTAATIPNGAPTSGTNQVTLLLFASSPTDNTTTFTITIDGTTTGNITWRSTAATTVANIAAALLAANALWTSTNIVVASTDNLHYTLTFQTLYGGVIKAVSAAITASTGTVTPSTQSAVTGTTYTSTTTGLVTNITAGAQLLIQNPITGVVASNATADGGTAFTGGLDPDPDGIVRASALKNVLSRYGAAAIIQAMLAVSGVYDAWVFDPQNASGLLGYAFCDSSGNTPGATGLNTIPTSGSVTAQTPTITAGSLADQVRTAVHNALPPGMAATGATLTAYMYGFNVQLLTAIPITYSAPSAVQSGSIGPQIQQAVINYIQGTNFTQPSFAVPTAINPQSGLSHNLALVQAPLFMYVQAALGGVLTNFTLGTTTPASTTASNAIVYRALAGPSSVTLTRV